MTLLQEITDHAAALPEERQLQVLDYVLTLEKLPKRESYASEDSDFGCLADLGMDVTKEQIDEMRREAWASFPRKI